MNRLYTLIFLALGCLSDLFYLHGSAADSSHIRAIVFDCDGTLVDSETYHYLSWRYALARQGFMMASHHYPAFVGKGDHFLSHFFAEKIGGDCAQQILKDKLLYYQGLQRESVKPIAGTVAFLHRLALEKERLNLTLAVASGAGKEEILRNLRHLGIEEYFDVVLSGSDDLGDYKDPTGTNKPKPYIYLHAAKLLNLVPEQCVAIEDSATGVASAVSAGCITVAIPNQFTEGQDLSKANLKFPSLATMSVEQFLEMAAAAKKQP